MKTSSWFRMTIGTLAAIIVGAETSLATVRTVAASGGGSNTTIKAAITASQPGDTIRIIESPHIESNISVSVSVTIEGLGANQTIVQAAAVRRTAGAGIFSVPASKVVTFRDLTLQNGNGSSGGAISVGRNINGTTVTVERCNFINNDASGTYGYGGAIFFGSANAGKGGSLTVLDSTFVGNVATNSGSGTGGALQSEDISSCVIRNSTFSSNTAYHGTAWVYGGGVNLGPGANNNGTALVHNCTFVTNAMINTSQPNSRNGGGAINGGNAARTLVESCVFAGNVGVNGSAMYSASYSNCVYEGTVNSCTSKGGNISTNNAKVNPLLAYNGGPTPTHALLAGSAAIGAGSNPAGLSYDQRGTGYARTINTTTDAGAFEYLAGPIGLVYSTNAFIEHTGLNNGSIDNATPMTITLTGNESFAASINVGTEVLVSNLPAGLTAVFTRNSASQLSVTLTGQATAHGADDDVADLTFAFQNAAFAGNDASAVGSATRSDLIIDFIGSALPPELTYNGSGFVEAPANNGSIATTWTISLANTDFTGDIGTNYVLGGEVLVSNLPAGLTAVVQKTGVREVTVSLTGNASAHNVANNIANLTLDFQDGALASGDASALVNDPRSNLTISYIDPVLTYNGTGAFAETNANNGAIGNAFTITLVGDTFTGSVNDDFADGSGEVTLSSPPSGLAWKVNRDSATQLTVSLTGNAAAHNAADSASGLALSFNNSAFTASTAAVVTNNSKSNYGITFLNPVLTYSAATFIESSASDGTVPDTATITLAGDSFTGVNGDDFAGDEVTVANVPAGLSAKLARMSPTQLAISFTGAADPHTVAANRTDVTFAFGNAAFTGNSAAIVTNNTRSNLSVLFRDDYYVNQNSGNDANNGSSGAPWKTLTNAVVKAPANSVINIQYSPHTEKDVTVNKAMIFKGQGAGQTIVQANANPWTGTSRLFNITAASGSVIFQDMTLRHGRATGSSTAGGAVFAGTSGGSLTITRCAFERNESEGNGGGAVYASGPVLTVRDSTFLQNMVTNNIEGNGSFGGAISASGPGITIANSTFSENKAKGAFGWQGGGGAIAAYPATGYNAGIYNCTFSSNALPTNEGQGGAIRGGDQARVTVDSCVFAQNNIAGSTTDIYKGSSMSGCGVTNSVYQDAFVTYYATMYDLGGNISTNNAGLDPVLADNGGPTKTHALLEGSAAINAGSNTLGLEYDQRGFARDAAPDIGAYEYGAHALGPSGTVLILF